MPKPAGWQSLQYPRAKAMLRSDSSDSWLCMSTLCIGPRDMAIVDMQESHEVCGELRGMGRDNVGTGAADTPSASSDADVSPDPGCPAVPEPSATPSRPRSVACRTAACYGRYWTSTHGADHPVVGC